jgi:hypothetical protein
MLTTTPHHHHHHHHRATVAVKQKHNLKSTIADQLVASMFASNNNSNNNNDQQGGGTNVHTGGIERAQSWKNEAVIISCGGGGGGNSVAASISSSQHSSSIMDIMEYSSMNVTKQKALGYRNEAVGAAAMVVEFGTTAGGIAGTGIGNAGGGLTNHHHHDEHVEREDKLEVDEEMDRKARLVKRMDVTTITATKLEEKNKTTKEEVLLESTTFLPRRRTSDETKERMSNLLQCLFGDSNNMTINQIIEEEYKIRMVLLKERQLLYYENNVSYLLAHKHIMGWTTFLCS